MTPDDRPGLTWSHSNGSHVCEHYRLEIARSPDDSWWYVELLDPERDGAGDLLEEPVVGWGKTLAEAKRVAAEYVRELEG